MKACLCRSNKEFFEGVMRVWCVTIGVQPNYINLPLLMYLNCVNMEISTLSKEFELLKFCGWWIDGNRVLLLVVTLESVQIEENRFIHFCNVHNTKSWVGDPMLLFGWDESLGLIVSILWKIQTRYLFDSWITIIVNVYSNRWNSCIYVVK